MKRKLKAGSTSVMLPFRAWDTSSTTGGGLSGLVYNTASLVAKYRRKGDASWTTITLASATAGTYTSSGFAVPSSGPSNSYEIHPPNAAFATGAEWVEIEIYGAANLEPVSFEIELDAVDYQDAAAFGLSRLDAAVSTRASQTSLDTLDDYVDTEVAAIKAKTDNLPSDPADASDIAASFTSVSNTLTTIAGYLDTEIAAIKAKTDNLPADPADQSEILGYYNALAATLTTLTGYVDTEIAAIKAKTDNLPSDPADASDVSDAFSAVNTTLATIVSYLDTEIAAIKAKTDNLPIDPADASDIAASFTSIAATLSTIVGYIDTEISAIKAKTDNLPTDPADQSAVEAAITNAQSALTTLLAAIDDFVDTEVAAIKVVTDKLNTMLQTSGANYQYTTDALENAPAGGGGGGGNGVGAFEVELIIKLSNNTLVPECDVIVTTTNDRPDDNIAASARSDSSGTVTFMLDEGVYYVWRQRFGFQFSNPVTLTVNDDGTYSVA